MSNNSNRAASRKRLFIVRTRRRTLLILAGLICLAAQAPAQSVLFDFDNAPIHTSLPIDLTVNGITAHFSATGQGFSIQSANTLGFTPAGFSGYCIYPNSVFAADLLVGYSKTLTNFTILYAPQELGCDDSATMKVTAYMDSTAVGTNTTTASVPGTWPTETLSISTTQGFNNVVVHYNAKPPTCQDWGPIFLADNMSVTPAPEPPPPPTLRISWLTGQIQLAWPTNAPSFTLQVNTNLLDTNTWVAATNTPSVNGIDNTITLPVETENHFYRLKQP